MTREMTILVATDGQGILRSADHGKTWQRLDTEQDIDFDGTVRCLMPDPDDPHVIYAGSEQGLCRSTDAGVTWKRIDCVLKNQTIWQLTYDPTNPSIMFAGTGSPTRAALYRSKDRGASWHRLTPDLPERCKGVGRPRFVTLTVDPTDTKSIWAGVEETGLFHSADGGDSWDRIDAPDRDIKNTDIHSVVILDGPPKAILVLVVNALHRSSDGGRTWDMRVARDAFGLRYARVMLAQPASPNTVFMGISDGTPGTTSIILRSDDAGKSWEKVPLPTNPNSCVWAFGANSADPDTLFAGTKYGHLFRSNDGGRTWAKEWREFSEITAVTWVPVAAKSTAAH